MSATLSVIISSATNHLGLFDDLRDCECVELRTTGLIKIENLFYRFLRKADFEFGAKKKYRWYQFSDILANPHIKCVLVIDTSLAEMDLDFLNMLKKRDIKIFLFLINATNAESPLLNAALNKINSFDFDKIFSFDPADCSTLGFEFLGFNYYSKHELPKSNDYTDAYFIGTIKGGRGQLVYDVFNCLRNKRLDLRFDVRSKNVEYIADGMNHITGKWIPYSNVLQAISNTNCIIEIMQNNQSGATLRYFEAVVYNKKLLSNNPNIVNFPYYNEANMMIFSSPDDIDVEWVKCKQNIDYGYRNDFSPVNLVKKIQEYY